MIVQIWIHNVQNVMETHQLVQNALLDIQSLEQVVLSANSVVIKTACYAVIVIKQSVLNAIKSFHWIHPETVKLKHHVHC